MTIFKTIRNNTILSASIAVALITLLTKLVGYVEKIVIAYIWGTGYEADTYLAIFAILMSIAILFREVLEPGLLNTLLKVRSTEGETESWRVFLSVFYAIGAVGLALSLFLGFGADTATQLFLSGFRQERFALASQFFSIGAIALFLLILCSLTNTYLLSYKKFTTIAFSELAFKGTIVLALLLLWHSYGIYAAAIGLVVGTLAKFSIQLWRLKSRLLINSLRPNRQYLSTVLLLSWPLLVGNLFSQVGSVADNTFASYLNEGAISALGFAKKIIELPVVLFPYTLSVVVFPFFSQMSVEKELSRLNRLFSQSLGYITLFFLPMMLFIACFPDAITRLIFERGAFDAHSTALTASALSVYNIGIVAFALETILVIFLFAKGKIRIPVLLGIFCVLLDITLTWMLIGSLDYLAIAWGLVVTKWLKVILLFYFTRDSLPSINRRLVKKAGLVVVALAVFAAMLFACRGLIVTANNTPLLAVWLFSSATLAFAAYIALLVKFRVIRTDHD